MYKSSQAFKIFAICEVEGASPIATAPIVASLRFVSGRRKRGSSSRRGGGNARPSSAQQRGQALEPNPDRMATELARGIASEARQSVREVRDALDAELFASSFVSLWDLGPGALVDADPEEEIGLRVVAALERAGDARALATLRAFASVGSEGIAGACAAAAGCLAQAGVHEPEWRDSLGAARGLRARLMRDVVFDDAANLIFEFERPGLDPYAILVLVDNNLGGIAKDIIAGADPERLVEALGRASEVDEGAGELRLEEIELAEAAARCREALGRTAHTLDPPVADDFKSQVAVLTAHLKTLPGEDHFETEEIPDAERDAALEDFLASPEAKPFRDSEDAADVGKLAVDYGADYVGGEGRPLRWSPTVVELFMCDYLPRKVLRDREFFERAVPDLLPAWVRYAGRSRGIPQAAIEEAASAVDFFCEEMLSLVGDESGWGPSKTFLAAASEAGVASPTRRRSKRM